MMSKKNQSGFTLAELIVVVVIIGIVGTLIINVIVDARERAGAAVIANTFRQVERGLYLMAIDEGITEWWHENYFEACAGVAPTSNNPPITGMISDCGLDTYLQSVSETGTFDTYIYDADGGQFIDCGGGASTGVNIAIDDPVSPEQFTYLDNVFDKGDGATCGDVRYDTGLSRINYLLGDNLDAYIGG